MDSFPNLYFPISVFIIAIGIVLLLLRRENMQPVSLLSLVALAFAILSLFFREDNIFGLILLSIGVVIIFIDVIIRIKRGL